jgi:hypothetical protein
VRPSSWYLTGFLISSGTAPEASADLDEDDDLGETPEAAGLPEESTEEQKSAKKGFFPSSMGLSFLVSGGARSLTVHVRWGDYTPSGTEMRDGKSETVWRRRPREEAVQVALTGRGGEPRPLPLPGSGGLELEVVERPVLAVEPEVEIPRGTRSVSVFLVNRRPSDDAHADLAFAFQSELEVHGEHPFVPRPDLRGAGLGDWDEQVADLHYVDTPEYATGHGVSAE